MVRSEDCDHLIDLNAEPESSIPCSICFDLVTYDGERSRAKLKCGHEFHLDCIGSAFNVKGTMQCPNCRAIEKGQWLYSSGSPACPELSMDDGSVDHYPFYFTLTELPYRVHICPFRGFTQVHPSSQSNLGIMSTFAPIVTHQHPGPNSHPHSHPHPHPHPHGWVQFQNTAFLHHHQASGLPMLISRSTGRFGAPRSMPRLMPSGQVYDFSPNFLPYADSSPRTWSRDNVPHFLLP